MAWWQDDLKGAVRDGKQIAVFLHAYPSKRGGDAGMLRELSLQSAVVLVELGHSHYNELANDGQTIYSATRSTGQVEEGAPGFSVTTLDSGVVGWKFKPIGEWPEKHILGTQPGPNENGRHWPSRRQREHAAQ